MGKLFRSETVIITGGLGDIGRAITLEFAEQGANVALCDILPVTEADEFINFLSQKYQIKSGYDQVDVSDAASVSEWVDKVERVIGLPGIIIANAATATMATILDITPAQWEKELRINLNGAFYVSRDAGAKLVKHKKAGRIVFIGSWAAEAVHSHIPAYSVSKAGLRMLCKCMALELAPHNILVNEIAPGYVDAGMSGKIFQENPIARLECTQKVPTQKLITAAEVAKQVLLICHPENQHITGTTILMDGGLSLLR